MSLNYYAPRTCYEFVKDKARRDSKKTGPLSSYRECSAYVLLGQPGIGKTAAFEHEATQPNCQYVTARDFVTFDIKPEWQNKTLFIDGLDEVRAGKDDVFSPFDELREKLDQLGHPRFRLSCRKADWYGASDRKELKKVSPDRKIKELFLVELTEEDLQQILIRNHHKTGAEASSFLEMATLRELTDLIKNPQILGMLVTVVGEGNEWPERKSEIFKLACEKLLLEEWNQTHNIAHRNQTPPVEELMLASGMLCAVILLARKQGFAPLRSDVDDNYPCVTDMADDAPDLLQLVARTRLFTTHDGHTEYGHRIFAEYLSAYYLSYKIINGKLPIGRVLALMTGYDGGVVSELRGVYAWLVTLCQKERSMLMERDPLGLVLYGDPSLFSKEERLELLYKLTAQARKTTDTGVRYENLRSFGAFCQTDMMQEFRAILESTDRSERHQYLTEYVLASMTHGTALPGLSDVLVSLLYDDDLRWWSRRQALDVLIRFNDEGVLRKILTDLDRSRISDPNDDLLGELLGSLYPDRITPNEIFDYLRPRNKSNFIGSFYHFWAFDITEKTNDAQAAELLDALALRQATLNHDQDALMRREMISNVLARGVRIFGDSIEIERLYGWISLGLDEHGLMALRGQRGVEDIRKWLEQHPQVQKNLIEHHLDKCSKEEDFNRCAFQIRERLFRADLPEDYGIWCLNKAIVSRDQNARQCYFGESVLALVRRQGNAKLSLELLESAAEDVQLKCYWDKNRICEIPPDYHKQNLEVKRLRAKQDQDKQAFLQSVRQNLKAIEAGLAHPGIFKNLGSAYYGYFIYSIGDTPKERLNYFFPNDPEMAQSVLIGLRRFIYREDIPDITEIFRVHMENKYLVYSHPYRAGMVELARSGPQTLLELNEDKIAKALAFYYVDGTSEEPVWYKTLLSERPELVAKVFVEYGTMALRAGKSHLSGSYTLAFDEIYRQLARLAVLPLLESFPARCASGQLKPLYDLLTAALLHADHIPFQRLVEKKLSLKSMDAEQRVLWLTAGLILDPEQLMQRLTEFVSGKESRINSLSGFLSHRGDQWSPVGRLPLQAVVALIELIGPLYAPVMITDDDYASGSASFASSEVITELISRLATFLTDEATDALESLLQSDALSKWHPRLRQTLHAQHSAKREAMFRHPSLEQVQEALKNGPPANIADLACITREHIRKLAKQIKYGNTNDFRQYWIHDKQNNLQDRQHEKTCRDRFLSDLRPLLENMQINAESEVQHVAEGQADIGVSFSDYNLPIEIKCNNSKDLWHGIRNQLIERYTIDPGAHGYGIYLVFWFGYEKTTPHPESGPKPRTPAELEERLSQLLKNDEERKKISVCVVDCTEND